MSLVTVENVFVNFVRLGILANHCLNGKMKKSGKVDFFEKNIRIHFGRVLVSESNGGIFDYLAPLGGEL